MIRVLLYSLFFISENEKAIRPVLGPSCLAPTVSDRVGSGRLRVARTGKGKGYLMEDDRTARHHRKDRLQVEEEACDEIPWDGENLSQRHFSFRTYLL